MFNWICAEWRGLGGSLWEFFISVLILALLLSLEGILGTSLAFSGLGFLRSPRARGLNLLVWEPSACIYGNANGTPQDQAPALMWVEGSLA